VRADIDKVTWSTTYYSSIETFEVWAEYVIGRDKALRAHSRAVGMPDVMNSGALTRLLLQLRREVLEDLSMYVAGVVGVAE
jgi:hypothetical protein